MMARESDFGDGADALREWRWRSYLDHLEDLGYDLDNGGPVERETPGGASAEDRTAGSIRLRDSPPPG